MEHMHLWPNYWPWRQPQRTNPMSTYIHLGPMEQDPGMKNNGRKGHGPNNVDPLVG